MNLSRHRGTSSHTAHGLPRVAGPHVTQKLLDVVKKIAKDELQSETWLRSVARLSGKSYEAMRVGILEFLDTGVFNVSLANCASFLDPLIESWDIDLATFGTEIILEAHSWICKEI
jgi:hypothetical protein